ncbi:hypothetical protein Tco_0174456 [Tanacetum coccineum]
MSDSEDFTVTYTEVSSPFENLSNIGSPRVDGLPMMPEDPYAYVEAALSDPSPDYGPGLRSRQTHLSQDFVFDTILAIFTPPPSPLTPYSSPLPQIPSPPLLVSSPLPVSPPPLPASPTHPLGDRAAMIRLRAESPSTSHLLPLPSLIRLCIAPGLRFEVGECSSAPTARPTRGFKADYGFVATLYAKIRRDPEREIGYRITDVWDTDEIYGRLDDAQDDRSLMSDQLNLLRRDRRAHARIARLMETEARLSLLAQQDEIGALREADRTRQAQLVEALTLLKSLETQKMAPKRTTRSKPATTTTTTTPIIDAQLKALINQGIADALAARDVTEARMAKTAMILERVNCTVENQIKFATCTLLGSALKWWNSHVRTVSHDYWDQKGSLKLLLLSTAGTKFNVVGLQLLEELLLSRRIKTKDAKLLWKPLRRRYGGNKESKNVQRTLLKQQYENFAGSSSETMDQTFDRISNNTAYRVSAAHTQSNPTSIDNLSDAVICAFLASQPNSPQLSQEDLEQIDPDDLEEMDLQWEMAMLTIRARRFIKRTGRKLDVNGLKSLDLTVGQKWMVTNLETPTENALVTQDGIGGYDWSYQAEEELPTNFALMAHTSLGIPPPYTVNFIPFKPDLMFMDEIVESENMDVTTIVTPSNVKTVESNHESADVKSNSDAAEPKTVKKNSFRPLVIED